MTKGKVLGGSSSINAMVYMRGHPEDYNRWEEEFGAQGWGYQAVLPFFRKAEAVQDEKLFKAGTSYSSNVPQLF